MLEGGHGASAPLPTYKTIAPRNSASRRLVNQPRAWRFFQRRGKRAIFLAAGAGEGCDPAQVILRRIAVALFDLPQAVILPGLDVVRIGLERALVPDLRNLVVAELAVGVADQVGDRGAVVTAERLELSDRGSVVLAVVDGGIGGTVTVRERGLLGAGTRFGFLLLALVRRRRIVVGGGVDHGDDGSCRERERQRCERQKPDRESVHAS